jgi:hypothetical protein
LPLFTAAGRTWVPVEDFPGAEVFFAAGADFAVTFGFAVVAPRVVTTVLGAFFAATVFAVATFVAIDFFFGALFAGVVFADAALAGVASEVFAEDALAFAFGAASTLVIDGLFVVGGFPVETDSGAGLLADLTVTAEALRCVAAASRAGSTSFSAFPLLFSALTLLEDFVVDTD